ncbi:hypothetical protein EDC35_10680 [Thiobaca trueperi]|uniref:Uncharacterized protein n=2 Tax=Thiobaca trueperi TaxID=127458 RepID=A0A4R3MZH2_9GAMM|nr:hypothetical protein EDC35_10680 [Thiobaca trueperi]
MKPAAMTARHILLMLALCCLAPLAAMADPAADVEQILRDIRQDEPVPQRDDLRRVASINADCAYFEGEYRGIRITVETHPNSSRVASLLLQIPGPDQTRQILPAVARVLGSPQASDPKHAVYGWEWAAYRTASLHYAPGADGQAGFTIVSLFYR